MLVQLARVENCPTHKGTTNEVTRNARLWSHHASSIDAFKAVGMEVFHSPYITQSKYKRENDANGLPCEERGRRKVTHRE